MILFPNAKINLGLNVVEKRSDGFHNIETVFYPLSWCDALEIIQQEKVQQKFKGIQESSNKIQWSTSGLEIGGDWKNNLIAKAYALLDHDFDLPPVKIHLHKIIPMGAGLGGGSADAAFALKGLNELFGLKLSPEKLRDYAKKIGSDCAFFVNNKPVFATEKGDVFEEININLSSFKILIVCPGIHSNTAQAYSGIVPSRQNTSIKNILTKNISTWKDELNNDFEKTIFEKYPEIKQLKEHMYNLGAVYASLSGSGSAVYGLFENEIPQVNFPEAYHAKFIEN